LLNHCLLVRCTFVTNEHYEHTFSVKKTNFIQSFKTLSIRVGSGRAQEFRPVQIFSPDQYACLLQLLLQYFPHSVTNWIQIWRIRRPQLRWQKFQSFLNNSMVTRAQRAILAPLKLRPYGAIQICLLVLLLLISFTTSCRELYYSGEVENVYLLNSVANLFSKQHQILSQSPIVLWKILRKIFWSFFRHSIVKIRSVYIQSVDCFCYRHVTFIITTSKRKPKKLPKYIRMKRTQQSAICRSCCYTKFSVESF